MPFTCLTRIISSEITHRGFLFASIPKLYAVQSANITSKEWRDPNVKKPAPWPYKTKKYTYFKSFFEGTVKRFDENTKIIVVDGTIGAGKNAFAKELADAFDMLYVPEPTLDPLYTTAYGFDLRKINDIVPPHFKSCEVGDFYRDPYHMNVAKFQYSMYMFRLRGYCEALAHLLNTGQGIVMERSVYSDFVFVNAMFDHGYLSKPVKDLYFDIRRDTIEELMRPHLLIYLDVSPEVALERIKKKNDPVEVNSPVLTKKYFETIEHYYKQHYLKDLEKYAEVLIYDWNNYGDVEVVVEDIERIDFDRFSKYDKKMRDWRKADDWEWGYWRRYYTNDMEYILGYAYIFRPSVDEVHYPREEIIAYQDILHKIPGESYEEGFNTDAGDSVLFKTKHKGYWYAGLNRYLERY